MITLQWPKSCLRITDKVSSITGVPFALTGKNLNWLFTFGITWIAWNTCRQIIHWIWHSSSTIHKHASVQGRLLNLQEQFRVHADFLQRQAVNSTIFFGACSFVINTGTRLSPSIFQPRPSGDGRFCIATRALLLICVWKFALLMWWDRLVDVGGSSSLFLFFWQKSKYRISSALVNRPPRLYKEQMKASLETNDSLLTARPAMKWESCCWYWFELNLQGSRLSNSLSLKSTGRITTS